MTIFRNYLTDSRHCVKINSLIREELPVEYGVPQGSILGPALFLVYINDLYRLSLSYGKIFTYADTTLIFYGNTWDEMFQYAQTGVNSVLNWQNKNINYLKRCKTKYISFTMTTTQPNRVSYSNFARSCLRPEILGCSCPSLDRTNTIKYQGVLLDPTLFLKNTFTQ